MNYVSGIRLPRLGFTLPEMLFSLTIISILLSMVGPSMRELVADRRVASITSEMYVSLILARSEAVKRRSTVSICSTVNGIDCDESNAGWENGWLVFHDHNGDGAFDHQDHMLKVTPRQPASIAIDWNRGNSLRFNSRGQTLSAGSFEICEESNVRAIVISLTGRARVEERSSCG